MFCKDIFGDLTKALSIKEMKPILNTFNFFGNGHYSVPWSCSFFVASRFTPHACGFAHSDRPKLAKILARILGSYSFASPKSL